MTYISTFQERSQPVVDHFQEELQHIRTGRAHPGMVSGLLVEAYGASTPLSGLAAIAVPESRVMTITPWDRSIVKDIEKAIMESPLGFNPVNEGHMLRITIPELTEERRQELIKVVNEKAEEARIGLRGVREDTMKSIKTDQKNSIISEDESVRFQKDVQKVFDVIQEKILEIRAAKEQELTTI